MVYSERQIAKIRKAGRLVGLCHALVSNAIRPGITTLELDAICEDAIRSAGAVPAFKGYRMGSLPPFPGTICASPGPMIVHGIPDSRPLQSGEVLSVDIGCRLDGYYGDAAWTYPVGEIDDAAKKQLAVGEACLKAGIAAATAGRYLVEIGRAIEKTLDGTGYSSVRDYVGHGVGAQLHEKPQIPHFVPPSRDKAHRILLRPGMTIAIEPMINAGTYKTDHAFNEWPVYTADRRLSVHFEHSIAILKDAIDILTLPDEDAVTVNNPDWKKMMDEWRVFQKEIGG